tara:strand:+ start:131 stop:355 length:225 start_codon:yes stop_codon:yes gene_type:complete
MTWFLPDIFGVDEQRQAYDMSRAHSADIWFLKVRAWAWGITLGVAALLIGNILGALGINFFGKLFELASHAIGS